MSRLVPMPPPRSRPPSQRRQRQRQLPPPTMAVPLIAVPGTATIRSTGLKSWHAFAFLIVTAVIWSWLKWPFIIFGTMAAIFVGMIWISNRFPKTMFFVWIFLRHLFR